MADLRQQFLSLAPDEKRRVHIALCQQALQKWREYTASQKHIRYADTVVGLRHDVDLMLPEDALASAKDGRDSRNVERRYTEPIVAMQDSDLEFPRHIEFAYYAMYNLFRKYALGEAIDDWLIVNQAISAEVDEAKWSPMLAAMMSGNRT